MSPQLPEEMKAIWHDIPSNTLSIKTLPVPTPTPIAAQLKICKAVKWNNETNVMDIISIPSSPELLLRVRTVALCTRELAWPTEFPVQAEGKEPIPGYDVAGTIVALPEDYSSLPLDQQKFKLGDEVYGRTNFFRTANLREYSIVTSDEMALRPHNLTWEESASVPLSTLTAWQALVVHGGLAEPSLNQSVRPAEGKRVLVTAASGGTGVWAVQLAKLAGATVVGTCSGRNEEFVRGLGVDEVVDYTKQSLKDWMAEDESRKVDLVLDCVGGKALEEAWYSVKDGGKIVGIVEPPVMRKPDTVEGVEGIFFIMEQNGEQLSKITEIIEKGKGRAVVDSVWEFEKAKEAFERVDGGRTRGKVVVRVARE